jgi:hypothetical protein
MSDRAAERVAGSRLSEKTLSACQLTMLAFPAAAELVRQLTLESDEANKAYRHAQRQADLTRDMLSGCREARKWGERLTCAKSWLAGMSMSQGPSTQLNYCGS